MAAVDMRQRLTTAVGSARGRVAADRLCEACVDAFEVDDAAVSLVFDGVNAGTLGASGPVARELDEMQFLFGEGPCLWSAELRRAVLIADLAEHPLDQWPQYVAAMLGRDVRAVFAIPVVLAGVNVGALDLFSRRPGPLNTADLVGALIAAELAELLLLDLLNETVPQATADPGGTAWQELNTLTRVEVSQAVGMVVGQLDVDADVTLVRLRAHAFATGRTATAVARDILDSRLRLEPDPPVPPTPDTR